jgi:hypothetical protein
MKSGPRPRSEIESVAFRRNYVVQRFIEARQERPVSFIIRVILVKIVPLLFLLREKPSGGIYKYELAPPALPIATFVFMVQGKVATLT